MKRVAVVTGGTRGIGFGIAQALAHEGFNLAVCGLRSESAVGDTLTALRKLGAEVLYCSCDVAQGDARAEMVAAIRQHFGRLDVLVNNAGMAPRERRDILEATEDSFEQVMRTNLQGPYFLTQAVAKWMIQQRTADANFARRPWEVAPKARGETNWLTPAKDRIYIPYWEHGSIPTPRGLDRPGERRDKNCQRAEVAHNRTSPS